MGKLLQKKHQKYFLIFMKASHYNRLYDEYILLVQNDNNLDNILVYECLVLNLRTKFCVQEISYYIIYMIGGLCHLSLCFC